MKPGTIIMLAGGPSVGKTSLSRALQTLVAAPAIHLDVDHWLAGRRKQARDPGVPLDGRSRPPLILAMQQTAATLARAGHSVIADLVLVDRRTLYEGAVLFSALPAFLVGVPSPPALPAGARPAPAQPATLHDPGVYDLVVDLARLTPHQGALQIRERLLFGPPPSAWRWLKGWSDPTPSRGALKPATTALTAPPPVKSNGVFTGNARG